MIVCCILYFFYSEDSFFFQLKSSLQAWKACNIITTTCFEYMQPLFTFHQPTSSLTRKLVHTFFASRQLVHSSTARVFGQTLWKFLSRIFPPWKDIFLLLVFPSLLFFFLYFVIFPLFQDYLQTVNSPAKTEITLQIDGWILTIFLELRGLPRPNFEAFVSSFEGFLCCLLTSNVEDYKCLLIFFFGEKILFGVPAKTTLGGFSF